MKLSEDLKKWRAERPDEWTMDRFIKKAQLLEAYIQDNADFGGFVGTAAEDTLKMVEDV